MLEIYEVFDDEKTGAEAVRLGESWGCQEVKMGLPRSGVAVASYNSSSSSPGPRRTKKGVHRMRLVFFSDSTGADNGFRVCSTYGV